MSISDSVNGGVSLFVIGVSLAITVVTIILIVSIV